MHTFLPFLLLMSMAIVPAAEGVTRGSNSGSVRIVACGTREYEEKVKQLKISPSAAREQLVGRLREKKPTGAIRLGDHYIIVNDDYVFGFYSSKIKDVDKSGYYVNGNTGEIVLRKKLGRLTEIQQVAMWGQVAQRAVFK